MAFVDQRPYTPTIEMTVVPERTGIQGLTAIVLCGGNGTRLKDVTGDLMPKPLVNLGSGKLIDHSIFPLRQAGIKNFIYAVGYRSEMVRQHISTQPDANSARFALEHTEGATSAIRAALSEFDVKGHTAILAADTVIQGLDFADAYRFHIKSNAELTLIATQAEKSESPSDDILIFDRDSTKTALIINDTGDNLTNPIIFSGMAICSPRVSEYIKNFEGAMPLLWDDLIVDISSLKNVHTYMAPGLVQANVNRPEDLERLGSRI